MAGSAHLHHWPLKTKAPPGPRIHRALGYGVGVPQRAAWDGKTQIWGKGLEPYKRIGVENEVLFLRWGWGVLLKWWV